MLPRDAERISFNTRLVNDAMWARLRERKERRRFKRRAIVGAIVWPAAYVLALRSGAFSAIYEGIGRVAIAAAVLIWGSRYLEWLLFPKDRPAKKSTPWDPEKAYNLQEPGAQ